ncbi:Ferroporti-1 [Stachybotrys elegans]|uniref:Solute carrier family 40 member n=1 Tax=Stachybotrys elegans TaxID=80388 RepID=A0A8K0SHN3_9HYPO|nr:Ferroporti-1 [Stachybotrys elegans]
MASQVSLPDERSPLLGSPPPAGHDTAIIVNHRLAPSLARRVYVSHFLSTWNSRVFEFGAVLFLASIFPGTLLPMSIYASVRSLSTLVFASFIGRYIDTGNRLSVARTSIIYQRLATVVSCVLFYLLSVKQSFRTGIKEAVLAILILIACVEKLCSIMNLVAIEKDWVVVMAAKDHEALGVLNAQMRRIDLLCKLFGPLIVGLLDGWSTRVAILITLAMNLASVAVEYFAIAQVYNRVPALHVPKQSKVQATATGSPRNPPHSIWTRCVAFQAKTTADFRLYFQHKAFLPSFSEALLNLTVLSFGASMVTYLLSSSYSSYQVAMSRTVSVTFEVLATWIAPWVMRRIGPLRAGMWFSTLQLSMLMAGGAIFWACLQEPMISASGIVGGTILSRVGLWGFDLCTQIIIQEEVEAENRGAFSSVEAAWQNMFEMLAYGSTAIFHRPEDFKWPVLISIVATALCNMGYATFLWKRRGHLLHLEKLSNICGGTARAWRRSIVSERWPPHNEA